MPSNDKPAPFFSESTAPSLENFESVPTRARRIRPWRKFICALIPNWLLRRTEVSAGAKLAYGRLAQYAGKDGECFPKQQTLATELGVCERTAHSYVRELTKFKLIESDRPGLGASNNYFFLDHPWIHEFLPEAPDSAGQDQKNSSAPELTDSSGLEPQEPSALIIKENQSEKNQRKEITHTQRNHSGGLPLSLVEALAIARQLGIEDQFASQEYHAKKSVGWKDGYGNPITSWSDHLKAHWPTEQRKRVERRTHGRAPGKRPAAPQRQFSPGDYNQSLNDF